MEEYIILLTYFNNLHTSRLINFFKIQCVMIFKYTMNISTLINYYNTRHAISCLLILNNIIIDIQ